MTDQATPAKVRLTDGLGPDALNLPEPAIWRARDVLWTTHTLTKLKMQDEAEGLFTADQMRAFALAWIVAERQKIRPLVEQCRAALAEELSAWDIDPPLHHVKTAHDACDEWLSGPNARLSGAGTASA